MSPPLPPLLLDAASFPSPRADAVLWVILLVATVPLTVQLLRRVALERQIRPLLLLLAAAAAVRLVVPFAPANWYYGFTDIGRLGDVFTKQTTYVPLPNRLLLFDLGLGSSGARGLNLVIGTLGIAYYWYAARLARHSERTSLLFAAMFAVVPMYVRYSASDASHLMVFFLFGIAAASFLRIAAKEHSVIDHAALFCAMVLAMPIRLESGALLLSIPFFLYRGRLTLRSLRGHEALAAVFLAACTAGGALLLSFHRGSLRDHGPLDPASAVVAFLCRTLWIPNPGGVFFFPPIFALPIWVYLVILIRRRAFREILSLYVPAYLCGLPSAFAGDPFVSLPAAGYHIISVVFVMLACARSVDALLPSLRALADHRRWVRPLLVLAALPCLYLFVFIPYRHTYAYQEEYAFLSRALPHEHATVLTVWDPDTGASDLDCCLAMPYPTLLVDFPNVHWIVLTRRDLDRGEIGPLAFDDYYPGTMPALDPASLDTWYGKLIVKNPEQRARLLAHLDMVRRLDAMARRGQHLTLVRTTNAPAHTFSSVGFRGDRVDLVMYETGES